MNPIDEKIIYIMNRFINPFSYFFNFFCCSIDASDIDCIYLISFMIRLFVFFCFWFVCYFITFLECNGFFLYFSKKVIFFLFFFYLNVILLNIFDWIVCLTICFIISIINNYYGNCFGIGVVCINFILLYCLCYYFDIYCLY